MPKIRSAKKGGKSGKFDDKIQNGLKKMSSRGKYLLATLIVVVLLVIIVLISIHLGKTVSQFSNQNAEASINILQNYLLM